MKKIYVTQVHIQTTRQISVKAENREEAIKKASAKARSRYGDEFTSTLSVPFLEGDE